MGHFRRTWFQIYVCAVLGARKDEGEGGGGSGSGVTRGKYEGGKKSRAGIPMQQRAWKMSFHFLAERRDLLCAVAANTRIPPHAL